MPNRIPELPPKINPVNDIKRPMWSVMIPVYNCYNYIKEALESVLIQDPGLDLMQIEVIDDYSTDGDVEALVKTIGKGRIGYYKQIQNVGSLRNFETCINRAKGHYIHLLHGDDCVGDGFYSEIAGLFQDYPHAGAAFTNFSYIDHESHDIGIRTDNLRNTPGIISGFLDKIAYHQLLQPPAIVVKREVYEALGSFYAVHFGEDWEMWTRIASKFPVAYSPIPRAFYRVAHGIGISHHYFMSGKNINDILKVIDIIQDYLPENKRVKYRNAAMAYHAKFNIRMANSLLLQNKAAALRQINGAWIMDRSYITTLWMFRFWILYLFRFKEIQHKWQTDYVVKLKFILE